MALKLSPLVFVRPGEPRRAEWPEFDLEAAVWRIPAAKMKGRLEHVGPLRRQTVEFLEQARMVSGHTRFVFPSIRSPKTRISENTVNAALRRLGFTGDETTAHEFRAMASTLLNASGKWSPDAIERALAHKDIVHAAYQRVAHWQERMEMAQAGGLSGHVEHRGRTHFTGPASLSLMRHPVYCRRNRNWPSLRYGRTMDCCASSL